MLFLSVDVDRPGLPLPFPYHLVKGDGRLDGHLVPNFF